MMIYRGFGVLGQREAGVQDEHVAAVERRKLQRHLQHTNRAAALDMQQPRGPAVALHVREAALHAAGDVPALRQRIQLGWGEPRHAHANIGVAGGRTARRCRRAARTRATPRPAPRGTAASRRRARHAPR